MAKDKDKKASTFTFSTTHEVQVDSRFATQLGIPNGKFGSYTVTHAICIEDSVIQQVARGMQTLAKEEALLAELLRLLLQHALRTPLQPSAFHGGFDLGSIMSNAPQDKPPVDNNAKSWKIGHNIPPMRPVGTKPAKPNTNKRNTKTPPKT